MKVMASESGPPTATPEPEMASKPTDDIVKQNQKKFFLGAAPFMAAGQLFVLTFIALVLSDWIDFSKIISTNAEELTDIQSRIGFVFKYSTFDAIWVLACLLYVATGRFISPAVDPTSGSDQTIQNAKNILNNSFEQFVLLLASQLALVQYLDGEHTVKYIPALTFLYVFGRITFALGYPKRRYFGFSLNITSMSIVWLYNFFKSCQMLF